ncbi:MAG: deoxyribonuclease IV [Acidobacteria bacterium]|nr:deoxyribonuclease IV [Acidobacteriota bacterium]
MNGLLAGAHVSIAGGIHLAFERGVRLDCRTIQVFLKNSNQWKAKELSDVDRALFLEAQKRCSIGPVIAHDSYLINLASPDRQLRARSLAAFIGEMERAAFLGIPCLVMHPGAHMGAGTAAGIRRVVRGLNRALDRVGPPVKILLENTAGQGTCLGFRFEHLAEIMERVDAPERVAVCFDTCHAHAAGYDIRSEEEYDRTFREFDRLVGISRICVFHVNDSRNDLGRRVDRHTHIGQGMIGLEAFRLLVNDRRFAHVPKIIETPKGTGIEEDLMNLSTLRSLAGL